MSNKRKGQGLVEFALVLPVILLLFCLIIECGRLFHAYTTVQHAAREGARYAVTGQEEEDLGMNRLQSIKYVTRGQTGSLMVDSNKYWDQGPNPPYYDEPGALTIRVWGPDGEDDPGGPGQRVRVRVVHNMPVITPLLMPIAKYVRVTGEVEMINEGFGTGIGGGGHGGVAPPPLPPLNPEEPPLPGELNLFVKADKTKINSGDTVRFTYSVFNDTGINLTNVQLADNWNNPVPGCVWDLPIGSTQSCTTDQVIDVTTTDDVSASSTEGKTANGSVTIKVIQPELTLTVGAYETTVLLNERLVFTYTVENTGVEASVTNVYVTDNQGGDTGSTAQDLPLTGDTAIWEVAHIMDTPGTIVVNATAIGSDELGAAVTDDDSITIQVLVPAPINIFEPIMAGQTVVTGTAEPGETVFIDDPQDSRISGAVTVDGSGRFSFTVPPLIAGHTIIVSGYGSYDSARVQGELAPIVITTNSLCHGTAVVSGTAEPGKTVYLFVPNIGYSDEVKADVDTGQFQFTLYGGLTFQVGQVVTVSGYDATPAQKTVTWCGGSDAYITVAPQCGSPDNNVRLDVHGENFDPDRDYRVRICWDALPETPGGSGTQLCTTEVAEFNHRRDTSFDETIRVDVTEEIHTIRAELWYDIDNASGRQLIEWAEATYASPCPAPNLIVTNVELQTTPPISTYMPIEFHVTVANSGTMPVNSLFWVDIYEPNLPAVGDSVPGIAWGAVGNLAPGDETTAIVKYTSGFTATGDHYVHARADSLSTVSETDEDDNDFTDFLVSVTGTGTQPGPAPGHGRIYGVVYNGESGAPAARAHVWCRNLDVTTDTIAAETYTEQNGFFILPDLLPGTYQIYGDTWIGGDHYYGILPSKITIMADETFGPVTFTIYLLSTGG
jgi:hypothetical protein